MAAALAAVAVVSIAQAATPVPDVHIEAASRAPTPFGAPRRHARLVKSVPAKDDTLAAAPKSLDLWFSEHVDVSLLRVTLAGPGGASVALGKAAMAGSGKDEHVTMPVAGAMGAGVYTVTWLVAGADGHPTRGSYEFRVTSKP